MIRRGIGGIIVIKLANLAALGAALLVSCPSFAAVIPATLTANGATINDPQIANDGIFPNVGDEWNLGNSVQFGHMFPAGTSLIYSFAQPTSVASINMVADGNDYYGFSFFNGTTKVRYFEFSPASLGQMQSYKADITATLATQIVVEGVRGDGLYSIGEVQFSDTPIAAVPEPATWAMMMVGFAMLGASARYRRRTTRAAIA